MDKIIEDFRKSNVHIPEPYLTTIVDTFKIGFQTGVNYAVDNVLLLNKVPPGHKPKICTN